MVKRREMEEPKVEIIPARKKAKKVCVGIYAVLIQSVAFSTDIIASLWKVMGFTILLAFTLFKTGAVAKSILHAH